MLRTLPMLVSLFALGLLSQSAEAAPIDVKGIDATASSELPPDDGGNYYARNLVDGKQSSVWVEGDTQGSGLGAWVELPLPEPTKVTSIKIWNGNYYSYDFWQRHNRVKDLEIIFSDESVQRVQLKDEMLPEVITIDEPVMTSSVKLRIKGIHRGTTFNDTVISEVVVMDGSSDASVAVKSFKASSVYPSDADGNYEAVNVSDGLLDSLWCENDASGDGVGEWLEFGLSSSTEVSSLRLVNGNAYSPQFCLKANRATKGTLSFSDGSKQEVDLKPFCMAQTVSFSPVKTSKVRLTFNEVKRGSDTENNDLCISEAYLMP